LGRAKSDGVSISNLVTDIGNLEGEVTKLHKILETISEYVDKVVVSVYRWLISFDPMSFYSPQL